MAAIKIKPNKNYLLIVNIFDLTKIDLLVNYQIMK